MDARQRFLYTAQLLDRLGGLKPERVSDNFGYREGSRFPDTSGLEPHGILDRVYAVDRFSNEITNEEQTVLVDVGCHSGIRFTADFARSRPRIKVIGIEISFDPNNFNGDEYLGRRTFRTKEDVLKYLQDMHNGLRTLELEEACFDLKYPLVTKYNGGQRILTGFRTPGVVGAHLVQQAASASIDLVLSTPINLTELKDAKGNEIESKDPRFRRFGYQFPLSDFAKRLEIDQRLLHRLIKAPYKRHKRGSEFVPLTPQDEYSMRVSILAKQLVCLDRCIFLEEHGFGTELWRYTDGDEGAYAPHHLIVGRKK